jgi:hypothetical protein
MAPAKSTRHVMAALIGHARNDPRITSQRGRDVAWERLLDEVDPAHELSERERSVRADRLRRARLLAASLKSARVRRERKTAAALHYPPTDSPVPTELPPGEVLVHNSVRPARHQGVRGSRFWTQAPMPNLERCDCDWTADHYRIAERKQGRPPADGTALEVRGVGRDSDED